MLHDWYNKDRGMQYPVCGIIMSHVMAAAGIRMVVCLMLDAKKPVNKMSLNIKNKY